MRPLFVRGASAKILCSATVIATLVACAGADTTGTYYPDADGGDGGSGSESHAVEQTNGACRATLKALLGTTAAGGACVSYTECAPTCCACATAGAATGFTAAACIDGRCGSTASTCAISKSLDYCPNDPEPVKPDGGAGDAGADTSTIVVNGALCVAFTGSHATDREAIRLAFIKGYIADASVSPGNGTISISRDSANRPTSIQFSASGSAQSYTVSVAYDSAGNTTSVRRSWSGSNPTETHSLSYDSANHATSYRLSWSNSSPTATETFGYDSAGHLTSWRQSWSDSQPTQTESMSFTSAGYLSSWRRSWSNSLPTETENFSYDSSDRLNSWRRSWSDSTPTESASMTYSSSARFPNSTKTDGPVPAGSSVVDCKK